MVHFVKVTIMPQTLTQWLRGYVHLVTDTLSQRIVDQFIQQDHPIFSDGEYLHGKTAIVTGANTGIGFETARMLCQAGAHVILACRNLEKAQTAITELRARNPTADVSARKIDLSSLESVRNFVTDLTCDGVQPCIDILVLNGGVMAVPHTHPETHLTVNHISHALLVLLLLPGLSRAPQSRVVFVTSLTLLISDLRFNDLHFNTRSYAWMTAYANSKLAMVLFMHGLQRRLHTSTVLVNAVHPGEAPSHVARYMGRIWHFLHRTFGPLFLLSVHHSARTSVYAAGAKDVLTSGALFHRISQRLSIPEHLVSDEDIDCMWQYTLDAAQVTKKDVVFLESFAQFDPVP